MSKGTMSPEVAAQFLAERGSRPDLAPHAELPDDTRLWAALVQASADTARDRGRIVQALREFDEAAIFTIHGLCQRILSNHAFESKASFDAELVASQESLIAEVVSDYWAKAMHHASPGWVRHVVDVKPDENLAFIDRMAQRYVGTAYQRRTPREIFTIAIDRVSPTQPWG